MKSTIGITFTAAILWTACVGPHKSDLAGQYRLIAVNENSVPATVQHGPSEIQVVSGHMSFTEEGTCQSLTVFVPPSGEAINRKVSADYRKQGSKLIMNWHGAGQTEGTFNGERFTMINEGMRFEYERASEPIDSE